MFRCAQHDIVLAGTPGTDGHEHAHGRSSTIGENGALRGAAVGMAPVEA